MYIKLINEQGEPVDLNKLEQSKPWVMIFPGSGLNLKDCGSAEVVEKQSVDSINKWKNYLTQENANIDNCEFICAYYSATESVDVGRYDRDGQILNGIRDIANQILKAKVIDREGYKLPVETAVERMSKLMMIGHCRGGMVVSGIERVIVESLQKNNYAQDETYQIVSAPKAVLSSVPLTFSRQPQFFDTFSYLNCSDNAMLNPDYCCGIMVDEMVEQCGFEKNNLFKYRSDHDQWKIPDECKIKFVLPKGKKNQRMLVVSSLEIPKIDDFEYAIWQKKGIKRTVYNASTGENEINQEYLKLQKRMVGGHNLSCFDNVFNLESSPFMQSVNKAFRSGVKAQLDKVQGACALRAEYNVFSFVRRQNTQIK